MEIDINKYIGIPYKSKGYSFDGADCYGLVWLFVSEEMGLTLPKFEEYDPYKDLDEVTKKINHYVPLLSGVLTSAPKLGDVALFNFRGRPSHFGIYIKDNRILHILKGTNSTYESISSIRLKGKLEGIYEIKQ